MSSSPCSISAAACCPWFPQPLVRRGQREEDGAGRRGQGFTPCRAGHDATVPTESRAPTQRAARDRPRRAHRARERMLGASTSAAGRHRACKMSIGGAGGIRRVAFHGRPDREEAGSPRALDRHTRLSPAADGGAPRCVLSASRLRPDARDTASQHGRRQAGCQPLGPGRERPRRAAGASAASRRARLRRRSPGSTTHRSRARSRGKGLAPTPGSCRAHGVRRARDPQLRISQRPWVSPAGRSHSPGSTEPECGPVAGEWGGKGTLMEPT